MAAKVTAKGPGKSYQVGAIPEVRYAAQLHTSSVRPYPHPVRHLWPHVDVKLVTTAASAWLQHGVSCSQGDVVLWHTGAASNMLAGRIQLHVAFARQTFCLAALFSLVEVAEAGMHAVWENRVQAKLLQFLCSMYKHAACMRRMVKE